jgi:hypothetical protein
MADADYRVPDKGCRISVPGILKNLKFKKGKTCIWYRVSRILYPVSGIPYLVSGIRYLVSRIRNRVSKKIKLN